MLQLRGMGVLASLYGLAELLIVLGTQLEKGLGLLKYMDENAHGFTSSQWQVLNTEIKEPEVNLVTQPCLSL